MRKSFMAEVTKATMPDCGRRGDGEGCRRRWMEGVEVATAIAPDDFSTSAKILYRKTKGIKLNRTIIVKCELTDRNKIFNDGRSNKDIVEVKGSIGCGQDVCPMLVMGRKEPLPMMILEDAAEGKRE